MSQRRPRLAYLSLLKTVVGLLVGQYSTVLAAGVNNDLEKTVTSVTIAIPEALDDSLDLAALQLANDDEGLDPSFVPIRVTRGVFEFRLSSRVESAPDAIAALRMKGFLVNPVVKYAHNRFIKYTDRITVTFDPGMPVAVRDQVHSSLGCRVVEEKRDGSNRELVEVSIPSGRSVLDIARQYSNSDDCETAIPEAYITLQKYDIDSSALDYRGLQWSFDNRGQSGGAVDSDIDAPYAWRVTNGSDSVVVAVLDCVFCQHPDTLTPTSNVTPYDANYGGFESWEHTCGGCSTATTVDERSWCAHGSMVIGMMAASHNNYGVDGLAPNCKFAAIKMCPGLTNCPTGEDCFISTANTTYANALRLTRALGAKIIVQTTDWAPSKNEPALVNPDSLLIESLTVLDSLRRYDGVAVFAAAGNSGVPICSAGVVLAHDSLVFAIGATDYTDERWSWSNYGPELAFMAPTGTNQTVDSCRQLGDEPTWDPRGNWGRSPRCNPITSRCHTNQDSLHICGSGGTSFAAPKAAGVAALVLSNRLDFFDSADVGMALYNVLKASAEHDGVTVPDTLYGWGRVNAQRALALVSRRGDPNLDGEIDGLDVVTIINQALRGFEGTRFYGSLSDLDCDSQITIVDVVRIIDVAFRGEPEATTISHCASVYDAGLSTWCDPAVLVSPSDKAVNMIPPVTLEWNPPEYWVMSSVIQVDDSPEFGSPLYQGDASSGTTQLTDLDEGTTYYWRVRFDGFDCSSQYVTRSFTTYPSSQALSSYENSVLVESKSFDCGDDSGVVGIYLSSAMPLSGLVLPLEIRNVSGDAYPNDHVSLSAANRLEGRLTSYSPAPSYLPRKDASGSACDGAGYATRADFEDFDGVSPDAVMFTGIAAEDTLMLEAGSDGEPGMGSPSLILTFGIPHSQGTFEIDTTCVSPANHLIYIDGLDTWNTVPIVPSFTKGVITVNGMAELAGHVSGHDTAACNASISADVIVDSSSSLTLLSGRTFTATGFADTSNYGGDGSRAEIFVYGQLTIGDSTGETVTLTSDSTAAGAWYGIRVMPGGHLRILSDVIIENAVTGITIDTAVVADTLRNCSISNCSYSGILTFSSAVPIISNSISDIPDGEGILAMDCDPVIMGNFISGCETGIGVIRSSGIVRDNLVEGTGGMFGVMVNQDGELWPGSDTLKLINDSVFGYFTQAHLQTSYKGHCSIDSCSFITDYEEGAQSSTCVKAIQDAWVKMRNSRVRNFGYYGVYSYKSKANLGTTSNSGNNSIYSLGSVDTCEECLSWCYYVRHVQSTPSDYLKAEINWWDANPPSAARFSGLVDRAPCLSSEPLPKRAPGYFNEVAASHPDGFEIGQNYPNPFNPSTTINFSIPISSHVSVTVYNVLGQQVNQVFTGDLPEGSHRLVWDGRNASGIPVASGVYFYTVVAGTYSETRKMVVLK